jgi:hypothetical protein
VSQPGFPSAGDYMEAVQSPRACFAAPDLRRSEVFMDHLGLPAVHAGNFAYVFRLGLPSGPVIAARCFARFLGDRQRRYHLMSRHLGDRRGRLAGFAYEARGIRVREAWYPLLRMEWVDGAPLNRHVERLLDNRMALWRLSLEWRDLVWSLERCQIAHGDLQHGNVLVDPASGGMRLVDYDAMWVPAMRGLEAAELGHPNYQHPGRAKSDFGPDLDRFSALVVYTALRALAEEPDLWGRYDTGENLLFVAADFSQPQESALLAELRELPAPLPDLARLVVRCCEADLAGMPALPAFGWEPGESAARPAGRAGPAVGWPAVAGGPEGPAAAAERARTSVREWIAEGPLARARAAPPRSRAWTGRARPPLLDRLRALALRWLGSGGGGRRPGP